MAGRDDYETRGARARLNFHGFIGDARGASRQPLPGRAPPTNEQPRSVNSVRSPASSPLVPAFNRIVLIIHLFIKSPFGFYKGITTHLNNRPMASPDPSPTRPRPPRYVHTRSALEPNRIIWVIECPVVLLILPKGAERCVNVGLCGNPEKVARMWMNGRYTNATRQWVSAG